MMLTVLFWVLYRCLLLSIYACDLCFLKTGAPIVLSPLSNCQVTDKDKEVSGSYIPSHKRRKPDRPTSVLSDDRYQNIKSKNLIDKQFDELVKDVNVIAIEKKINATSKDQLKKLINQKDKYGYTPLLWCLDRRIFDGLNVSQKDDYLSILNLFLNHPDCDLSILDNHHRNIVHWAVIGKYAKGCKAVFNRLMASKEDGIKGLFNQKDYFGYPPLHYLILDASEAYDPSHLAILKQFLSNDIYDINVKDSENLPLLYWLMHYKQPKLIKELLASDKVEPLIQYISKKINQWASFEPIKLTRLLEELALSNAIRRILSESIRFLTDDEQSNSETKSVKKLFLEKYICLNILTTYTSLYPCKEASIKDDVIKKLLDQEKDLISKLDECAKPLLASHECDRQNDLILELDLLDKLLEQIQ